MNSKYNFQGSQTKILIFCVAWNSGSFCIKLKSPITDKWMQDFLAFGWFVGFFVAFFFLLLLLGFFFGWVYIFGLFIFYCSQMQPLNCLKWSKKHPDVVSRLLVPEGCFMN